MAWYNIDIIGASITTFFSILTWYLIERFKKKKQKKDLQLLFKDIREFFEYIFSENYRTKEFKVQKEDNMYSTAMIIWRY